MAIRLAKNKSTNHLFNLHSGWACSTQYQGAKGRAVRDCPRAIGLARQAAIRGSVPKCKELDAKLVERRERLLTGLSLSRQAGR